MCEVISVKPDIVYSINHKLNETTGYFTKILFFETVKSKVIISLFETVRSHILGVSRAYFRFSRAYGSKLISCIFFLACFSSLVHFNNTLTHVTGLIKYRNRLKLSTFAGMAKKKTQDKLLQQDQF